MSAPGRIRQALADKLIDELERIGVKARVFAGDLHSASGHWRTSRYADCMRWDGSFDQLVGDQWFPRAIGSFETMTACVRAEKLDFLVDRLCYEVCSSCK